MDILRVLSSPDLEVRKKTLQLALSLVSSRNIEEVCTIYEWNYVSECTEWLSEGVNPMVRTQNVI